MHYPLKMKCKYYYITSIIITNVGVNMEIDQSMVTRVQIMIMIKVFFDSLSLLVLYSQSGWVAQPTSGNDYCLYTNQIIIFNYS